MTEKEKLMHEALTALYAQVSAEIADDVKNKVLAAYDEAKQVAKT